ncbi:hypothetical protein ACOMHN_026807 [Nucella lapillus]
MVMMTPFWFLFFFLVAPNLRTDGKRVVVIPMPHTSHTKYHINIAHQLVKLGHQVWLTIPDYILAKGVLDTSHLSVIDYTVHTNVEEETMHVVRDRYFSGEGEDLPRLIRILRAFCETYLKNETLFEEIRKLGPDFIIIDNTILTELSVIPYRLKVPFAFVGSAYTAAAARVPYSPAVLPVPLFPFSDHMKFSERLKTLMLHLVADIFNTFRGSHIAQTYAPEMPYLSLNMLVARADLWLVEMDHILDYPRPSLPNVKLIGGTATGPAKPLPPNFQSFMDSAAQGVVIVSFGSYILHLPKDISDKLLQVLLQLPLKSIFRSNLTSPDPNKILTSTWIPQNDLLGHPNTKVFFTHCGKNGQYEALYHAVPMVSSPVFVDQFYNAKRAQVKGFSETVDLKTTTAEEMLSTVMKVATDERYKQAIGKASELFRIEFGIPVERAAFWVDHVMKYGGTHMRSAGQDMPFYQFLGLDVFILLITLLFAMIFMLSVCSYLILKCLVCRKQKQKEE